MLPSPVMHIPGRRASLAELIGTTSALPGGRLLVRGDPGLGKTTLLERALADSDDRGVRLLVVRASERNEAMPHSGLIDLFDTVTPAELDLLPAAQREPLDVALSREAPTGAVLPLTLRVAVSRAIVGLLEQGSVAVIVDDWNLLDDETSGILEWVFTRRGAAARAALIATERAAGGFFRFARAAPTRDLFAPDQIHELDPLGAGECTELLARTFGERLTGRDRDAVARLARGNPLWALEIAHDRLATGGQAGHARDIPGSIADLLMARVQALPPSVAEVLAVVSALGECSISQVLRMIGGSAEAVDDALDAGVILDAAGRLRLAHPLLGTASMAAQSGAAHRSVHARAALVASSAIERASHLDRSLPSGPHGAVADELETASREARRAGAPSIAASLAERALDRTPESAAQRPARVVLVAETAFARGELRRAIDTLRALDIGLLTAGLVDRILPILVDAVILDEGEGAVLELLERWDAAFSGRQPLAAIVQASRAQVESSPTSVRRRDAEQALVVLSGRSDVPIATHRALRTVVLARLDAGEGLDQALLARAGELESQIELLPEPVSARAQRGFGLGQIDDLSGSARILEELLADALDRGDDQVAGFFSLQLAVVAVESGEVDSARRLVARFDESILQAGAPGATSSPNCALVRSKGLLALSDGDLVTLTAVLALPSGSGAPGADRATKLALSGLFAARSESWGDAVPLLQEAIALSEGSGIREPGRRLWCDLELGESLVALGRLDEAALVARRLQELAGRGHRPLARARALRLTALVRGAGNDPATAEGELRAALDLVPQAEHGVERARICLELGRVMRRRRARTEARGHFEQALALAEAGGDRLLAARLHRELARSGETASPGELTAAEQRVAAAVCAGARNSDIAASQFMSRRTVEAHLSAIYRKYGVHSRLQLVAELTRRERMPR